MAHVWVVRHADGTTTRQPGNVVKRRVGAGAVRKAASRRRQFERDLAKQRSLRIERALTGLTRDVPRDSAYGEPVERLTELAPSEAASGSGIDVDVPGVRRRGSVAKRLERRVSYDSVLRQRRIVNGLLSDEDGGGDVLAHDVRSL